MRRRAVSDWEASSKYPIRLEAGDPVSVGPRDDTWTEYRRCVGPEGREGWVPDQVLRETAGGWVAAAPYDATELTVAPGDTVDTVRLMARWWWCRANDGREGWVPDCVLGPPLSP
jgi:SH3-like domain-containing protein